MSQARPAYLAPAPLGRQHDVAGFNCGVPALDIWLRRHALNNELAGGSRTYVVAAGARVCGYYSLAAGSVGRELASGRVRRNMPELVPAIILGRLAVDQTAQGQGLGGFLLRDAVLRALQAGTVIGVRVVLVHAVDEAARAFYVARGFHESPVDPLVLMVTLDEVARSLAPRQGD